MSEDQAKNEVNDSQPLAPSKKRKRRETQASPAPTSTTDDATVIVTTSPINVDLAAFSQASEPSSPPVPVPPEPPEPEPAPPTNFAWQPPQHFQKLPQDFLIYSPDKCEGRSILSIPLDVVDLPRDKTTIKALVCLLLEPTLVVDADGTVVEGRVGQEVLVECGHFVRRLIRAALDPRNVGEVWMRPVGKLAGEGGDTITLWDIQYGKTYPRDKVKRSGR